ncbi:hypothetical protein RSOLAG22IIIB_10480 [Rhizoctonia solani]|uniref:Uncharacterized protein n=1 Tax=Rhizoctonia solani TaxID=456999 RepID=A0A0K6G472_9AGAM|nr:hypothetical protein RSOLAG22IIIB_10480 [Rhizoctonia solani]
MKFKGLPSSLVNNRLSREENIRGSSGSSAAFFLRTFGVDSHDRRRPCLMEFHSDWQHPDCKVIRWYRDQQVSSTRFRSIQHRRNTDNVFLHEFLLLELSDGSVCRVERTGDGSNVDAIRNVGCLAADYIQWFTASEYNTYAARNTTELIAHVDFHHDFDIEDVLAICYAIQRWRRTSSYTLQRFNCYFLCGTVLLVLARRLAQWERILTPDTWRSALQQARERLHLQSHHLKEQHLFLRVCQMLEPDNSNPADVLFGALTEGLSSRKGYETAYRALAGTLWRESWGQAITTAFAQHVEDVLTSASERGGMCAERLKLATTAKRHELMGNSGSSAMVHGIAEKQALCAVRDGMVHLNKALEERHRMDSMEHPTSRSRRLMISLAANALGILFPVQLALSRSDMEEWGFKGECGLARGVLTAVTVGTISARRRLRERENEKRGISVEDTALAENSKSASEFTLQANYEMADRALKETLAELQRNNMVTYYNVVIALHMILSKNLWNWWLKLSICKVLVDILPDLLPDREQLTIKASGQGEIKTFIQYQEFMRGRIRQHANRVEQFRLAAAQLVYQDIQDAVTDVWQSVPLSTNKEYQRH